LLSCFVMSQCARAMEAPHSLTPVSERRSTRKLVAGVASLCVGVAVVVASHQRGGVPTDTTATQFNWVHVPGETFDDDGKAISRPVGKPDLNDDKDSMMGDLPSGPPDDPTLSGKGTPAEGELGGYNRTVATASAKAASKHTGSKARKGKHSTKTSTDDATDDAASAATSAKSMSFTPSAITSVEAGWDNYDHYSMDLGSVETVASFLAASDDSMGEHTNLSLPVSLDVWMNEDLVAGADEFGTSLLDGYIAFVLAANANVNELGADAAYVVVADMYGNIKAARPSSRKGVDGKIMERFEGLKMWNASTLLMSEFFENVDPSMPKFLLWNWQTGAEEPIETDAVYGSHDAEHVPMDDALMTVQNTNNLTEYSLSTGEAIWGVTWESLCWSSAKLAMSSPPEMMSMICGTDAHFNRVQQASENTVYAGSRDLSGLLKIEKMSGNLEWILGGPFGDFATIDLNGTTYPAGYEYWTHQHNFEWIGANKFIMFDNGASDPVNGTFDHESRFLMLEVDEIALTATVVWEWSTGEQTPIWGDADLLPNGNVVGPSWNQFVDPTSDGSDLTNYQAHIWEVTSEKELAWSMHVEGACIHAFGCDPANPKRYLRRSEEAPMGWAIYSAERFMVAPAVTSIVATAASTKESRSSGIGGTLVIEAYMAYRSSTAVEAHAKVTTTDGSVLGKSKFELAAMWAATSIEVDIDSDNWATLEADGSVLVEVYTAKGEATTVEYTYVAA